MLTLTLVSLAGCTQKLTWIKFNDQILNEDKTPAYILEKGIAGSYVVAGDYKVFGGSVKAGQCVLNYPPYKAYFRIKTLMDTSNVATDPRISLEIKSQEEEIKKLNLSEDL